MVNNKSSFESGTPSSKGSDNPMSTSPVAEAKELKDMIESGTPSSKGSDKPMSTTPIVNKAKELKDMFNRWTKKKDEEIEFVEEDSDDDSTLPEQYMKDNQNEDDSDDDSSLGNPKYTKEDQSDDESEDTSLPQLIEPPVKDDDSSEGTVGVIIQEPHAREVKTKPKEKPVEVIVVTETTLVPQAETSGGSHKMNTGTDANQQPNQAPQVNMSGGTIGGQGGVPGVINLTGVGNGGQQGANQQLELQGLLATKIWLS